MPPDSTKVNRRRFLRTAARWTVGGVGAVGFYAWRIEPHWVDLVEREMPLANLPASLEGKRVVQLTDLHVSRVVDQGYLERAIGQAVELNPDIVLVTGDLMTAQRFEQVPAVVDLLRRLDPDNRAVYVTPGNHDYGRHVAHPEMVEVLFDQLAKVGIRGLRNEIVDYQGLQIVGCDELWGRRMNLQVALAEYDDTRGGILMTHNPDSVDLPGWDKFRGWILAGHTHGGQCRLPYFGAPIVPIRNTRYTAGEVVLAPERRLYVNRGLGYSRRIRFLCSPEITSFRLTQAV